MTITVNAKGKRNTHHSKLSYGGTDVGLIRVVRTSVKDPETKQTIQKWLPDPKGYAYNSMPQSAVKTYTGEQGYADTPPPWTPIAQDDWSGGRGSRMFERDRSKFSDSYRCNTTRKGEIILGPWDYWSTGINSWTGYWEAQKANATSFSIGTIQTTGYTKAADSFVATGNMASFWLLLGYVGSPSAITVNIIADVAGFPTGATVATTTIATTSLVNGGHMEAVRTVLAATLTVSNTYWISLEHSGSATDYWTFGVSQITGQSFKYYISPTWGSFVGYAFYHRICLAEDAYKAHFFEYKGSLFAALKYDDGGDSRLFLNGDQGVATGGSTTTLVDSTKSWTNDQWIGAIVKFNEGTGSAQDQNYALITDNDGTTLTFAAQPVGAASGTIYSIVGTSIWTEMDTTSALPTAANWDGLTTAICTDVLSVNHGVLFAFGDSVNVQRMRRYNNAGTWTNEWVDETGGQFTHLQDTTDPEGAFIWGAKGGYPATIAKAASRDWSGTAAHPTVLTWEAAINCGDVGERIRGLNNYGQFGNLHVMKEGSVVSVTNDGTTDHPYKLGLTQMGVTKDYRTGVASLVHNNYLYFSYHNTLLRYNFSTELTDNVGPTRDEEGLPSNRLGPIVALASYENLILAAFDGGNSNYSTIMAYNDYGWHEYYRAPSVGLRIRNLFAQSIPGDNVDRLHFSCGSDMGWLPMASDPYNFPANNDYHHYSYTPGGHVILSYTYFNQQDVLKAFNTIRTITENSSYSFVYVDYRMDTTDTWTTLTTLPAFINQLTISSSYSVSGRRIQFRISPYIYTNLRQTPRVTAVVSEALVQQKYRKYVEMLCLIGDKQLDLLNNPDDYVTYDSKKAVLETWAQNPYGVLVRDVMPELDNKYYKLDTPQTRIIDSFLSDNPPRMNYIVQLRMYECAAT